MFVALSILVQQLTLEKRVDVFSVVRKLRTQRLGMIQTFVSTAFFLLYSYISVLARTTATTQIVLTKECPDI